MGKLIDPAEKVGGVAVVGRPPALKRSERTQADRAATKKGRLSPSVPHPCTQTDRSMVGGDRVRAAPGVLGPGTGFEPSSSVCKATPFPGKIIGP